MGPDFNAGSAAPERFRVPLRASWTSSLATVRGVRLRSLGTRSDLVGDCSLTEQSPTESHSRVKLTHLPAHSPYTLDRSFGLEVYDENPPSVSSKNGVYQELFGDGRGFFAGWLRWWVVLQRTI